MTLGMKMKHWLTLLVCSLVVGCATTSRVERDLQKKVPFAVSQTLLREVIAGLNEDVTTDIRIEPRLAEVADICITHLPNRKQETYIPLGVALDILRMQTAFQYKVEVDWRIEDDHILLFYSGGEDGYRNLKKRD